MSRSKFAIVLTIMSMLMMGCSNEKMAFQSTVDLSSKATGTDYDETDSGDEDSSDNETTDKKIPDEVNTEKKNPDDGYCSLPEDKQDDDDETKKEDEVKVVTCDKYPLYPGDYGKCSDGGVKTFKASDGVIKGTELYVFSMYNSTNKSHGWVPKADGYKLDRYLTNMAVVIPPGKNKVVLVLSSYEPTHWKISGDVSRVAKVLLYGYHCQQASGVNSALVSSNTYEQNGQFEYIDNVESGKILANKLKERLSATLVKTQYVYSGTCVDRTFVATP